MEVGDTRTIQDHLRVVLERLRPECVIDVGANAGQFGQGLRNLGYGGWIVSFEPVRDTFEHLAELAAEDPRWRVHRLALGSAAENRPIYVTSMREFSSFRQPTSFSLQRFRGESEVQEEEDVRVVTLDECAAACLDGIPSSRLFLKIDTQGWDLEVLKGAGRLLGRCEGLQLELSLIPIYPGVPTYLETLAYANEQGFSATGFFPITRDDAHRLIEMDCVFVRSPRAD